MDFSHQITEEGKSCVCVPDHSVNLMCLVLCDAIAYLEQYKYKDFTSPGGQHDNIKLSPLLLYSPLCLR